MRKLPRTLLDTHVRRTRGQYNPQCHPYPRPLGEAGRGRPLAQEEQRGNVASHCNYPGIYICVPTDDSVVDIHNFLRRRVTAILTDLRPPSISGARNVIYSIRDYFGSRLDQWLRLFGECCIWNSQSSFVVNPPPYRCVQLYASHTRTLRPRIGRTFQLRV